MFGAVSVGLGIWPDLGSLMIGAFVIPAGLFFHRFWTLEDEMQKMSQTQLFYRNLSLLRVPSHHLISLEMTYPGHHAKK